LAPYWPHRQPDPQILGSKARERLGIKLHEPWWPGPGSNRRPSAVQMEVIAGQARSCWSDRTRWTSKRTFQPVVPRLTADNRRTDFVAQPRGWTRCTTPASCIGMARRDAAFATVPTHHVNGLLTSGGDPQRHTVDSAGAQLRKQRHRPRAELRPRHVDRAPSTSTGSPRTTSSTPTSRSSGARRSLDGFATIDHVRGGGTSPRSVTRAGVGLIRGRCVPAAQREDR
jgi:hypothetical protein